MHAYHFHVVKSRAMHRCNNHSMHFEKQYCHLKESKSTRNLFHENYAQIGMFLFKVPGFRFDDIRRLDIRTRQPRYF